MRSSLSPRSRWPLLAVLLLALTCRVGDGARPTSALRVEISNQAGTVLTRDHFSFVGIEQTLVARITPAVERAEFEWTVDAPVLRTYEHDIQRADRHRPVPLTAQDRAGAQLSFFWTKP